jgi:hypothetical protein
LLAGREEWQVDPARFVALLLRDPLLFGGLQRMNIVHRAVRECA